MAWVIGPYELDNAAYELRCDGRLQTIEPQVFELLVLLLESGGRLVTKEEIIERIWKGRIVSEASISSRIKVARQAIGDDGSAQRLIKTVHGRGFRFVGEIIETQGSAEPGSGGAESERPEPERPEPAPSEMSGLDVPALPDRPSIVVLPFELLSPDPAQQHILDGLLEEVTSGLSCVRSFFVIARGSAKAIAAEVQDVRIIAQILGVRYVLQGGVRFAGDAIRVTVQLIDGPSREEVWNASFDDESGNVFEVQDRITEAIVGALEPNILLAEVRRARRQRPDNIQAYDHVLRAMPLCWSLTREGSQAAIEQLEAAIALDAGFGLAHALLSWCYGQQCVYNWAEDPSAKKRQALACAQEAIAQDPDDPLVLIMLGTAECVAGDVRAAAVHVAKGLELDPNSSWGWNRSGYIQCYLGQAPTAIAHFERSLRLSPYDPMRHNVYVGMGLANFVGEDYTAALRWADKGLMENPKIVWVHRLVAACAAMAGDQDRAVQSVRIIEAYAPDITVESIVNAIPHQDTAVRERYRAALMQAGFKMGAG